MKTCFHLLWHGRAFKKLLTLLFTLLSTTVLSVAQANNPAPESARALIAGDPGCLSQRQVLAQLTGVMVPYEDFASLYNGAKTGELSLIGVLGDPTAAESEQLRQAIAGLQAASPVPILFGSDEESRSVQRLDKVIYKLPSTRQLVDSEPFVIEEIYRDYASAMGVLGFHLAFGPVVDLGGGPGIKRRSFGSDARTVADTANAVITGLAMGGVHAVIKHFPGHGNVNVDSHDDLPTTQPLIAMSAELSVYRELFELWKNSVSVMVGHLNVPGLTGGQPASLSADAVTRLLRTEMGFNGVIITDSLDMGAIARESGQAVAGLRAIRAGADIALVSRWSEQKKLLDQLEQTVLNGELSWSSVEQSAARVLALKEQLTGRPILKSVCGA